MSILSDEIQLGLALQAFSRAHYLGEEWAARHLLYFTNAGISSMSALEQGCKENTVNIDLDLFGIPRKEQLSDSTVKYLRSFLPGPRGFRCFRLAQKAGQMVEKGTADTEYVHRPESGKIGEEQWRAPAGGSWTLNVDCAGFVRNCLKHVTNDRFVMLLSDRDFMRAKDFFGFFSTIPYTVMDMETIPEADKRMRWRIVPDLRLVIPGDVIVYRPKGNAAGGAAFTTNDRKDLNHLLKAVKAAQLFREMKQEWENLGTHNVAKDPRVKPWVQEVKSKLKAIGIFSVKNLRQSLGSVDEKLQAAGYKPFKQDTLDLMRECCQTTCLNTGHIVFCAGIAEHKGDDEYRVRVVHSTKYGKKDENGEMTTGVQEHYRRFQLVKTANGKEFWTRITRRAPAPDMKDIGSGYDTENPNDDMEEDETPDVLVEEEPEVVEPDDELVGQSEIEVLAARMCF